MSDNRTAHQPLHPSILDLIDPEYRKFHEEFLQYKVPSQSVPWSPSARDGPLMPGNDEPVPVGELKRLKFRHCTALCWIPRGEAPKEGWSVLIYYHGGGWTLSKPEDEAAFCSRACANTPCIVISVDYRLAPEHVYPAAVEDAEEVLRWVSTEGATTLNLNKDKIAVGGLSAGGNLAAVSALKASQMDPPVQLAFQLLCLPVLDNTAASDTLWSANAERAPWLTPDRMTWYRQFYLPDSDQAKQSDASPLLAPDDLLAQSAKAWIAVAELDILRDEARAYHERLTALGVSSHLREYAGTTHSVMLLPAISARSREMVQDALAALKHALN